MGTKADQHWSSSLAQAIYVRTGLLVPELPYSSLKGIETIRSPLGNACQPRDELVIAHQRESVVEYPSAQDINGLLMECRIIQALPSKPEKGRPKVDRPSHSIAFACSLWVGRRLRVLPGMGVGARWLSDEYDFKGRGCLAPENQP
jgi:hypothetical protein